jgi:hypothetical protein
MEKHVGAGRYAHSSLDERGRVRLATRFSDRLILNQRNLAHVNQAGNSSFSAAAHSAFDALRSVGCPGITNGASSRHGVGAGSRRPSSELIQ